MPLETSVPHKHRMSPAYDSISIQLLGYQLPTWYLEKYIYIYIYRPRGVFDTPRSYPRGTQVTPKGLWVPNESTIWRCSHPDAFVVTFNILYWKLCFFGLRESFSPPLADSLRSAGAPRCPKGPLGARWGPPEGPIKAPSMRYFQHMTQYPFNCLDTNFWYDILQNMDFKA